MDSKQAFRHEHANVCHQQDLIVQLQSQDQGTSALYSKLLTFCSMSATHDCCATVQVSAGHNHTLALASSNQVWSWGNNEMGQAGIPDGPACLLTPACIQHLPSHPILFIVAGGDHSMVVMRHAPQGPAHPVGKLQMCTTS